MEVEVSAEAKDKRLNRLVAITVVILSVFMGLGNIKDGNIVQAMEQAKADSMDRWGEYQATRTKAHIAETARSEIALIATTPSSARPLAAETLARIDAEDREVPSRGAEAGEAGAGLRRSIRCAERP